MFSDCTNTSDCVNINPSWKEIRELTEGETQTVETEIDSQESQNPEKKEISCQTEEVVLSLENNVDYNEFKLLAFLQKVELKITNQLKQNITSKAFDFYTPLGVGESLETEKISEFRKETGNTELEVSALSWNCTGSILAVAHGMHLHDNWCQHDAYCLIWNLSKIREKIPQHSIESDCCLTSVSFHPKLPSILAVGKFCGILTIYNISGDVDDPNLASSEDFGQDGHKEPVTSLDWLHHPDFPNKLMLVSSSLDGKILFWKLSEDMTKMDVIDGFVIISRFLPRNLSSKQPDAEVGVSCISFNPDDPNIFIIGTEGGVVSQCSLSSNMETNKTLSNGIRLKSPIGMSFSLHNGYVEAIDFSPHTRNVFCSCSSDGELRVYTLLQAEPLISLRSSSGLKGISWSPICPMLMGAVSSENQFLLYDLYLNPHSPVSVKCPLGSAGASLTFNKKNYQLVATATVDGKVQVWRIGNGFQSTRTNELSKLLSLGSVNNEY